MTELSVKEGDSKRLVFDLDRDLTGVTAARVVIASEPGATPAVDRSGVIETPVTGGLVSLTLAPADYGVGKLEAGKYYKLEIETTSPSGTLTHPDDFRTPFLVIHVVADLA